MTNELPESGGDHPELSNELRQFAADLSRLIPRDDRLDRRASRVLGRPGVCLSGAVEAVYDSWPFSRKSRVAGCVCRNDGNRCNAALHVANASGGSWSFDVRHRCSRARGTTPFHRAHRRSCGTDYQ